MKEIYSFFSRPQETFAIDPRLPGWILADAANPLNQIANMIRPQARVLDIGAGNGILARLLSALEKNVTIDAIEPNPAAGELAKPHYHSLFAGTLEDFFAQEGGGQEQYDYIVMADVLEHIGYPESSLQCLKSRLAPRGRLLCSTPNVSFSNIRLGLLHGKFTYVDSGILERTHLRFYTLATLLDLFTAVGWHPASRIDCLRDPLTAEPGIGSLPFSPLCFARMWRDPLARVFQFVFALELEPAESMKHATAGNAGNAPFIRYCVKAIRTIFRG